MVLSHRLQVAALQALQVLVIAMDLQHLSAAGLLVQVVHVLGDDPGQVPPPLELGQRPVSRVAELAEQGVAERPVKFPGLFGGTQKDLEGGILVGGLD